jgi:hypothetical protein
MGRSFHPLEGSAHLPSGNQGYGIGNNASPMTIVDQAAFTGAGAHGGERPSSSAAATAWPR